MRSSPKSRNLGQQSLIGALASNAVSLEHAAAVVDVSLDVFRSWFYGWRTPTPEQAALVHRQFGVDPGAWERAPDAESQETRNMLGFMLRGAR